METIVPIMMKLIKGVIDQSFIDCSSFMSLTSSQQDSMYSLAASHSIANMVGEAVGEYHSKFQQAAFESVFQYEMIQHDLNTICSLFDSLHIPYILLKGSRLCHYYPQPWLRSRGDIDILILEKDVQKAVSELCKHDFVFEKDNYHDVHLTSPSNVCFELHFKILENTPNLDVVLSQVWEYSHLVSEFEYEQSNEYFVFHQVAHMAYHFMHGGCGIRPLIDLYVLKNQLEYDESIVVGLCKEAKIGVFYKQVQSLMNVWFGNGIHSSITLKMQEYILTGGVYGSKENRMRVKRCANHNSFTYYLSRLFLDYDTLCFLYPSLKGHHYLLPYYEVKRWCRLFNKEKRKSVRNSISMNRELSTSSIASVGELLEKLDLK